MRSGPAVVIGGVALAALSLVFTGVLARPLLMAGAVLVIQGALSPEHPARRALRVWIQGNVAVGLIAAIVLVGAAGYWATLPFFHRRAALTQLDLFSGEGHRLEADLVGRARAQPLGDLTSRVQDWHQRVARWVADDLGTYYRARLGAPEAASTYPPQLHPNLHVFWDVVETDLGTLTQFETELSRWLR